jgi:hypothetical protein
MMYQTGEQDINVAVNDFMKFCHFIDEKNPTLSARKGALGKNALFEINSLIENRRDVTAPNYQQESYPVINLMFVLALNGELYQKKGNEKGKVYLTATERKNEFDDLNAFEKYAFLLDIFWTRYDLNELTRWERTTVDQVVQTIAGSDPGKKLKKGAFSGRKDYDPLFSYATVIIQYFSYFGLCTYSPIVTDKPLSKYDDSIQAVIPTEFGVSLCKILSEEIFAYWNIPFNKKFYFDENFVPGIPLSGIYFGNEEERIKVENLHNQRKKAGYIPLFKYLAGAFPLGTLNNTVTTEVNRAVKGNFIFKVSLGSKIWRKIRLSSNHTLNDLHLIIQEAFHFDNDHLYTFFMDARRYSDNAYNSPWNSESPYADEAIIGKLLLYQGKKILYLFDYGDSWEFDVQLLKINEDERPVERPEIIEIKGEAPPQYDDWE